MLLSGVEIDYQPLYPELGLTIWSPLAGGRLTDSTYRNPQGRAGDTIVDTVKELAGITDELVRSRAAPAPVAAAADMGGGTLLELLFR